MSQLLTEFGQWVYGYGDTPFNFDRRNVSYNIDNAQLFSHEDFVVSKNANVFLFFQGMPSQGPGTTLDSAACKT